MLGEALVTFSLDAGCKVDAMRVEFEEPATFRHMREKAPRGS